MATPTITLNKTRASLGSPLEVTYKFVVASGAKFDRDYRIFVHFVNAEDEQMWTDDHDPPRPTSTWKPGETIEYTRTVFVPSYPYNGRASIVLGLHSRKDGARATLAAKDRGLKAYDVATFELVPQGENVFLIYKDETWHPAEDARDNGAVSWRWSRRAGVIAFRNPKRDATFYLQLDGRPDLQPVKPADGDGRHRLAGARPVRPGRQGAGIAQGGHPGGGVRHGRYGRIDRGRGLDLHPQGRARLG